VYVTRRDQRQDEIKKKQLGVNEKIVFYTELQNVTDKLLKEDERRTRNRAFITSPEIRDIMEDHIKDGSVSFETQNIRK
jgi:hypothetical protein